MSPTTQKTPSRIFISYKHHADPDEPLAQRIANELLTSNYEVFIDKQLLVGVEWAEEISREVKRSDYLVLLITEQSCQSAGLRGEIEIARKAFAETGKPRILPVRLAFSGELPYPLNGWLEGIQYVQWNEESDTTSVLEQLQAAIRGETRRPAPAQRKQAPASRAPSYSAPLPLPGGGVPVDDPFYVARSSDDRALKLAAQTGQTIILKAPRQMGKTSLLFRMASAAQDHGKKVAFVDLQLFGHDLLFHPVEFYRSFAKAIADQFDAGSAVEAAWDPKSSQPTVCTQVIENQVLKRMNTPVCIAIDEADLMLSSPNQEDFFGMLRAWHGLRANPIKRAWKTLDLYLVTSTEPGFFIQGHQSPFNVTPPIQLARFNPGEVEQLNADHGRPLDIAGLQRLMQLTAGHPYLTRLALYQVSAQGNGMAPDQLFSSATDESSPFSSHLRRFLLVLIEMPELLAALRDIVRGRIVEDAKLVYRLEAAGLVTVREGRASPSCELYAQFFRDRLP